MRTICIYKQEKPELFNIYLEIFNLIHTEFKKQNKVTTHCEKYTNNITEYSPITVYTTSKLYKSYQLTKILKNGNILLLVDNDLINK